MDKSEDNFQRLLQEGISSARRLFNTLEGEYDALGKGDLDAFIAILEHKHQALSELQIIDSKLTESNTLWDSGDNLQQDEFCSLMKQCRHQNAINGRIIHMRQNHTGAALAILRGQVHAQEMNYDPRGKSTTTPSSTHIASA